jgi:DNA-binding response OmpR family regulator
MIEKVIDNLISNAIKYSKPNTEVNLNFEAKGSNWIFEVVDQGIGINRKAHRQLFKEFYRAENAINVKIVGSGIGLLLVKNYVNMHGGRITFSSKENVGSSFKVIIPYRKVEVQALLKADIPEKSITDNQILHNCETNTSKDSLSILIVEDNDDLRNFIKMPLSREFNVVLANDGCQAWDIVQNDMPDMVVSDVMMPNMDGFELCRLMKSTYKTSHIPIILLTALSGRAEQLQGLGLGADDYLTKPFDMGLLSQRIKTIIRNREQVREKAMKIVDKNNTEPIFQNKLNDQFVKQALDVVVNNLSNSKFGKEEFASEMNVSSSLLYKKIKSFTDQSPTDFIKCIRLNKSVELLKTKEYSVTEVSEMCGFSSVGYFSTVFKKHFGNSPTETE